MTKKEQTASDRANGETRLRNFLQNGKPKGYTWRVEKLTPMQRAMMGHRSSSRST